MSSCSSPQHDRNAGSASLCKSRLLEPDQAIICVRTHATGKMLLSLLWFMLLGLVLGGCGSGGGAGRDDVSGGAPTALSKRSGLELRRWIVRDQRGQSARLLSTFASADAFEDPAEARRWQMSGILVAKIAASDVPVLREQLSSIAQERIEWLGAMPDWVPVHRTAQYGTGTTAWVDSGPMQIDPGSLSLLARAWAVPSLDRTSLRIELMPQIPVRGAGGDVFIDGAPLTRQRLGVTLQAGDALLILPAAASHAGDNQSEQQRPEFDTRPPPVVTTVGPPVPQWPTLGELLLVALDDQRQGVYEQVMVFVAHVPQPVGGNPSTGQASSKDEPLHQLEAARTETAQQTDDSPALDMPSTRPAPVESVDEAEADRTVTPSDVADVDSPAPLSTDELLSVLLYAPESDRSEPTQSEADAPATAPTQKRRTRGMVLP